MTTDILPKVPAIRRGFRLQFEPAQGCHVLLYPEGMIKLNDSASEILQQVDGKRSVAEIIGNLHQRFPDYPFIARAYLLAARGFAEGLGQLEPAQKLLAFILARYPQSPLLGEVRALQTTLAKLTTQA